jgi:outer membrane protein assembly factor BamB
VILSGSAESRNTETYRVKQLQVMAAPISRRQFVALASGSALTPLAGCTAPQSEGPSGVLTVDPSTSDGEQTIPDGVIQFRNSLERWGYYPDATVPGEVEIDWRLDNLNSDEHSAAKASAVPLPDGGVLFPGDTGILHALDPDGAVRWQAETDLVSNGIHGTPAVADGRVYVGAYDGRMYAFEVETGDELWNVKLGGSIGSSPLYYDGQIVIAVEYADPEGKMFALDAETGDITWDEPEHRPTDHPHATPAVDPSRGYMVCGSNDGYLYCWSLPDLEFEWRFATDPPEEGDIKGPIAIYDGAAFFGSWDHKFYRVDLETGTEDWSYDTGHLCMSGPGIDPRVHTVFMGSHDDNLYALDASSGEVFWQFETDDWITGCPTICKDRILVGSKDETLYAVEKATGDEVWRVENDGVVTSTPRVIDGAIYYAERAPDPENGKRDGGGYKLVPAE